MLTGNIEYGQFGDAHGPIEYKTKEYIDSPNKVADEGYLSWSSAIHYFMTPNGLNPSMHDVMTNYWVPNGSDMSANFKAGFGATTAIIGGTDGDCNSW